MNSCYAFIDSKYGQLLAVADAKAEALTGFYFVGQKYMPALDTAWKLAPEKELFKYLAAQMHDYARGNLQQFEIPFAFAQGTPFQRSVWNAIAAVPYGQTITYGQLAERVGAPGSARAAGAATGRNPISLIVPCHRIVGSNGALTGYAGGLERKKIFLEMEAGIGLLALTE